MTYLEKPHKRRADTRRPDNSDPASFVRRRLAIEPDEQQQRLLTGGKRGILKGTRARPFVP